MQPARENAPRLPAHAAADFTTDLLTDLEEIARAAGLSRTADAIHLARQTVAIELDVHARRA